MHLESLKGHGVDAVSFQSLETGICWWHDRESDEGTGATVAYLEAGRSWIAVGTPLVDAAHRGIAAHRFAQAARARNRRAVFFGVESLAPFGQFKHVRLGLQPVLHLEGWTRALRRTRKLREQVRRARAKGVTVRQVDPSELVEGAPLRLAVDRLRSGWLATRSIEPMGFLLTIEPFHAPDAHLYLVAERDGVPVEFLSAVPIYERGGWLLEDIFRSRAAPNGTTELVIDAALRTVASDGQWVTPGLTPLSGDVSVWLRAVRLLTRPLYDFEGLRRFRSRLHPSRWDDVWLVWDRGPAVLVIADVLRGFARGRLLSFAWRSLTQHPNGPPWLVAVPLVAWTALLALCALVGRADVFGFSTVVLAGWIGFDALLLAALFSVSRRPRLGPMLWVALATGLDAAWSIQHLARAGFGHSVASAALRLVATLGPVVGTTALMWAAFLIVRTSTRR